MPTFVPVQPPRNPDECPRWLYETLKRLNKAASTSFQGLSAVVRGESPDGSGSPLVDLTKFLYKPGILGGQTAYGDTQAGGSLTLGSTANTSKGFIYFGAAGAIDEANKRFGLGVLTPAAKIEVHQTGTNVNFAPSSTVSGTPQWRGSDGGSSLHTYVDEATPDDSDFISDGTNLGTSVRLGLPNITPQANTATITISFRIGWTGTNGGTAGVNVMSLSLRDGAGTTIHTDNSLNGYVTPGAHGNVAYATVSFTLSPSEITSIANWNGMSLQISDGGGGVGYAGSVTCSWMQFSIVGGTAVDLVNMYDLSDILRFKVSKDGYVTTPQLLLTGSVSGTLTLLPAATTTSYQLTFPSAQGAANTLLKNDGSGNLSFVTAASLATRERARWAANGPYIVGTTVDGGWIVPTAMTISAVWLHRATPGTSSSSIVDLNKNGVTMYTTQANRPTIAFNDSDNKVQATLPDITSVAAGDILTMDIDQIEGGIPGDLTLTIEGA
jgi:hypothetical protein